MKGKFVSGIPATLLLVPGAAYFILLFCLWAMTHAFYRIRVRGGENLPKRDPALVVCNHISFIDPFLIGAGTAAAALKIISWKFCLLALMSHTPSYCGLLCVTPLAHQGASQCGEKGRCQQVMLKKGDGNSGQACSAPSK